MLRNVQISSLQGELEVVTISGYKDVPENNEGSLIKALAHQPLSVAIEASGRDFQFYSGVSKILNCYGYCCIYYLALVHNNITTLCRAFSTDPVEQSLIMESQPLDMDHQREWTTSL